MDWLSPIRELFGFIFPVLDRLPIVRAILGFILVFFLPGFVWTLVLFKQVNVVERIALSFGLSIALVTLCLLLVNRVGVKITGFNSTLVIIILVILPLVLYYLNSFMRRRKKGSI